MYLHLGRDVIVSTRSVLGIFDLDTSTSSKHTRTFLREAEKEGRLVSVTSELPKSAVLCLEGDKTTVYLSQLSSQTLFKRAQQENLE